MEQIEALRSYFSSRYGLSVAVLPPWDVTDAIDDLAPGGQYKLSYAKFEPQLRRQYGALVDSGARIDGITPIDMHGSNDDLDSFTFGVVRAGGRWHVAPANRE